MNKINTGIFAFLLIFSIFFMINTEKAVAFDDDYFYQKHSMMGPGVKYSSDKPGFKSFSKESKKKEKVKKVISKDPMDGGLITKNLFGGNNASTGRYRYKYDNTYAETTMFKGKSVSVLCEECKARAVLSSCKLCKGKSFNNLCDKCKAKAILNACEDCKKKIQKNLDSE